MSNEEKKKNSGCGVFLLIFLGCVFFITTINSTFNSAVTTNKTSYVSTTQSKNVTPKTKRGATTNSKNVTPKTKRGAITNSKNITARSNNKTTNTKEQPTPAKRKTKVYTQQDADMIIKDTRQHVQKLNERSKKYYMTRSDVENTKRKIKKLKEVKSNLATDIPIDNQAVIVSNLDELISLTEFANRTYFASSLENQLIESRYDANVNAIGNDNKILKIIWPLMSRVTIRDFRKNFNLDYTCKNLGFSQIVFSDGYNESWTSDLTN